MAGWQNEENALDLYTLINSWNNCLLAIIEKYNMNDNHKKQLEELIMFLSAIKKPGIDH